MSPSSQASRINAVRSRSPRSAIIAAIAWLFSLVAAPLNATGPTSSGWIARVWQASDGLTDNRITGIAQTPDGYLWVATLGRLVRFNGSTFEEFQVSAVAGVTGQGARTMFLDTSGDLWLSAIRGQLLHVTAAHATVYDAANGVPAEPLTAFAESGGTTWLAFGDRLFRFEPGRLVPLAAGGTGPIALAVDADHHIWCAQGDRVGVLDEGRFQPRYHAESRVLLARAKDGGVWVCSGQSLHHVTPKGRSAASLVFPEPFEPTALLEDTQGGVWIGTLGRGLFRVEAGRIDTVETSHLHISALVEDKEGSIWAGTLGGGLNRLRRRTVTLAGPRLSAPFEAVSSVAEDPAGAVWVATESGHVLRAKGETWAAVTVEGLTHPNAVTTVIFDRAGRLWAGTQGQGLVCCRITEGGDVVSEETFLPDSHVRALFAARDGAIWCVTEGPTRVARIANGAATMFPLPAGVRVVRAITEDKDGAIWLGTTDGRVLRATGGRFAPVPVLSSVGQYSVRALHATDDGSVWIGYAVQGIGRWHEGKYARIGTAGGLPDNSISQIVSDRFGGLWAASQRGIFECRLDEATQVAAGTRMRVVPRIVGRDEGLPDLQAQFENQPAVCLRRDGTVLFATSVGLIAVNPGLLPSGEAPPPVVIERATIDDRTVALRGSESPLRAAALRRLHDLASGAALRIPPGHRRLAFDFTALRFADLENLRFRYRLDGFDNAWIEPGRERSAQYSRLPPGTYRLRVIASSGAGVWSESGASLTLIVEPSYWQTWWFRGAALVVFTLLVVAVVRIVSFQRLRHQLRLAEQRAALLQERTRIARDIHDDLGGTLTHIKLLSELAAQEANPPEATRTQLRQITNGARQMLKSLDETIWAINPRNDRLPDLISYVGQHAVEFLRAAGISCEVDLPESPADIPVRSELRHHVFLVVKEALTNVVRHAGAREVLVRATVDDRTLTIVIADDGRGFSAPTQSSFSDGVRNMRQRVGAVGGTLVVESEAGRGTTITLRVDVA